MSNFQLYPLLEEDVEPFSSGKPSSHFSRAILLELNIQTRGRKLEIFIDDDGPGNNKISASEFRWHSTPNDDSLAQGLGHLISGNGNSIKLDKRGTNNHSRPATPMSLNFPSDCYVVLSLSKHLTNVRFSSKFFALQREVQGRDNPIRWSSRINGLDSNDKAIISDDRRNYGPGNRYAFFAYKRSDITASEGDTRFNIYLDVVNGNIEDGRAPFIPIVIDPDVRFPGGNEAP